MLNMEMEMKWKEEVDDIDASMQDDQSCMLYIYIYI